MITVQNGYELMKTLFQATMAHTNTTHTHRTAEKGKIIK